MWDPVIPLHDNIRSRSFAFVNLLLILANFAVFMHELNLSGAGLNRFMRTWGMDPARVVAALRSGGLTPGALHACATLVSAEFIHGGWLHILGNMVFLWVFGDNVEDRMGHGRYLIFYIVVGVVGNLVFALLNPNATIPTIGASGSIAGVLGAYLVCYPRARVLTVILILFFPLIVSVPAVLLLLYWFGLQLLNGLAALGGAASASGVAWWAHVGGFTAGMLLLPLFARRPAWRAP
jgi:membrane associated rhomboid family serine protease